MFSTKRKACFPGDRSRRQPPYLRERTRFQLSFGLSHMAGRNSVVNRTCWHTDSLDLRISTACDQSATRAKSHRFRPGCRDRKLLAQGRPRPYFVPWRPPLESSSTALARRPPERKLSHRCRHCRNRHRTRSGRPHQRPRLRPLPRPALAQPDRALRRTTTDKPSSPAPPSAPAPAQTPLPHPADAPPPAVPGTRSPPAAPRHAAQGSTGTPACRR